MTTEEKWARDQRRSRVIVSIGPFIIAMGFAITGLFNKSVPTLLFAIFWMQLMLITTLYHELRELAGLLHGLFKMMGSLVEVIKDARGTGSSSDVS